MGDLAADAANPDLPLVVLLGKTHDAFENDVNARLGASPFADLSLALSRNVLRHIEAEPCRASQVVDRCDVSKQAVSAQVARLERSGYLTVRPDPCDRRAHVLTITPRGKAAQEVIRSLLAQIEAEWVERLGAEAVRALRGSLARAIARDSHSGPACRTLEP